MLPYAWPMQKLAPAGKCANRDRLYDTALLKLSGVFSNDANRIRLKRDSYDLCEVPALISELCDFSSSCAVPNGDAFGQCDGEAVPLLFVSLLSLVFDVSELCDFERFFGVI